MKYITVFLSISLFMLINPGNNCHGVAQDHVEVKESKAESDHCHNEKGTKEKKENKTASANCHDCLSICCHFFAFEPVELKNSVSVNFKDKTDNWPNYYQYKKIFIQENFRPPIVG